MFIFIEKENPIHLFIFQMPKPARAGPTLSQQQETRSNPPLWGRGYQVLDPQPAASQDVHLEEWSWEQSQDSSLCTPDWGYGIPIPSLTTRPDTHPQRLYQTTRRNAVCHLP